MLRSRNYPPSPALAPFIARHYVFDAELPPGFGLVDRLLAETAFVRILIRGDWAASVGPGEWRAPPRVVFTGANSRPLLVRVRGPFYVVGVAFRPCGWRALFDRPASDFTDRFLDFAEIWDGAADALLHDVEAAPDDQVVVAAIEAAVAAQLARRGARPVDAAMAAFERIARNDSTRQVKDVADELGLSARHFERLSCMTFGDTPKTILRRSRFLDMAAVVRGLGTPSDDELAALRYFDQSHRTREFHRFIGMTPGQFAATPTPLLDAGLELRTLRKREAADA